MKTKVLVLGLVVAAAAFLGGCGPGMSLVIRPEIYNYSSAPAQHYYPGGIIIKNAVVAVKNNSPYDIVVEIKSQETRLPIINIPEGSRLLQVAIPLNYGVTTDVIMVADAYKDGKRVEGISSATRTTYFTGGSHRQEIQLWVIKHKRGKLVLERN